MIYQFKFLVDRTLVTVELLAWLSFVCPSVSNGYIAANGYGVGKSFYTNK